MTLFLLYILDICHSLEIPAAENDMRQRTIIAIMSVLSLGIIAPHALKAQPPDTLWTQAFGGADDDLSTHVQVTSDGGCIVAGYTLSYSAGDWEGLLVKTDIAGTEEWTSVIGGNRDDRIHSVRQTVNGEYVFTGFTLSFGAGDKDLWMGKTNSSGELLWQVALGGGYDDQGHLISLCDDGGYIITGETSSFGPGGRDFWLVKTDASGNVDWDRTFGGPLVDYCHGVEQTYDGGYILIGTTESYGAGEYDFWLIKTDAYGNEEWSRTYGGPQDDSAHGVHQTDDGGYILGGCSWSYTAGGCDFWLIKTDVTGNEQWSNHFGGYSNDCCYSVQETTDGGYVLAGWSYSFGAGECDYWVIKTDFSGDEIWNCTLGGSGLDHGQSIQQTGDGGFVVTGHSTSYGSGGRDAWLVKLAGPPVYVVATPQNPPVVIPGSGGQFEIDVEVGNYSASIQIFDVWADVLLPSGSAFGPLFVRSGVGLLPDESLNRHLIQSVGSGAPPGEYRYSIYAGIYPDSVISVGSFTFFKEGSAGETCPPGAGDFPVAGWEETLVSMGGNSVAPLTLTPHPNPFNATTMISFSLPEAGLVNLRVYDVMGREDGHRNAGTHEVTWDASDLTSGVYLYQLQAGDFTVSGKIGLMK